MTEVMPNLFVGTKKEVDTLADGWAVVHATKTSFVRNDSTVISLSGSDCFLNWVDAPDEKYFDYNGMGTSVFSMVLNFIEEAIREKKVFIYCDKGHSRSPSVAMVYMAKRANKIPNVSFYAAADIFEEVYESYLPSSGIRSFLINNWNKIV